MLLLQLSLCYNNNNYYYYYYYYYKPRWPLSSLVYSCLPVCSQILLLLILILQL